ncbi:MAG: choice-of-anchor D domain-containing protein [Bacteroidales bacterium]|nr:choice-of-anchor D domain-containing protein [Bacteroidales bacterium]
MKMYHVQKLIVIALLLQITTSFSQEQTRISSIISNPLRFSGEVVKISGLVRTYIPASSSTTAYYLLMDDYSDVIQISTSDTPPVTNQKYCVTGILYTISETNGRIKFFVSEQARYDGACNDYPIIQLSQTNLSFGKVELHSSKDLSFVISNSGRSTLNITNISVSNKDAFELINPEILNIKPGNSISVKVIYTPKEEGNYSAIITITSNASNDNGKITVVGLTSAIWWKNPIFIVLFGGGLILFILLFVLLFNNKKNVEIGKATNRKTDMLNLNSKASVRNNQETNSASANKRTEYETVIIDTIPLTIRSFPGEFEIVSGIDKGKRFNVGSKSTSEGQIVNIGREQPDPSDMFFHIQLKENTVGRKQAQLIELNGKVYLKNLGTTNHSFVDGKEVLPEQKVELFSGSILQFGDVRIKYHQ